MSVFFGANSPLMRRVPFILERSLDRIDFRTDKDWKLFRIWTDDISYLRLIVSRTFNIEFNGRKIKFLPAFHFFDEVSRNQNHCVYHNHQIPALILPFSEDLALDKVLYQMPWQLRGGDQVKLSGEYTVKSFNPYGFLEPLDFWHAVSGVSPHLSFNLADIASPPQRENRLKYEVCKNLELQNAIQRIAALKSGLLTITTRFFQES